MKYKILNRCNLVDNNNIIFVEDYKVQGGGMIKGYYLVRTSNRDDYETFTMNESRTEKEFNNLCSSIKVATGSFSVATKIIEQSEKMNRLYNPLELEETILGLFKMNKDNGQFKEGKYKEFQGFNSIEQK